MNSPFRRSGSSAITMVISDYPLEIGKEIKKLWRTYGCEPYTCIEMKLNNKLFLESPKLYAWLKQKDISEEQNVLLLVGNNK